MWNRTWVLMLVVGSVGLADATHAELADEFLVVHNRRTGNYAVMRASDGGGYREVSCGGDLTRGGAPRYFLRSVAGPIELPDGYLNSVLTVATEDCGWSTTLAGQPSNVRFSTLPQWSPDGSRIAAFANWFDPDSGIETASGIYLADVVRDGAGRPVGITNLALAIPMPGEGAISWSGDGGRIAYVGSAPDGRGGQQLDVFVADLASGASYNLTATDDTSENQPSWSPVDERIAFTRFLSVRGAFRYDLFVLPSSGGEATQLTAKGTTGKPQNILPAFSPDGRYLAFSSGDAWYRNDLYRIRSDGSGKAVNLTAKREGDFRYSFWRP